jgi:hypothetical protein
MAGLRCRGGGKGVSWFALLAHFATGFLHGDSAPKKFCALFFPLKSGASRVADHFRHCDC